MWRWTHGLIFYAKQRFDLFVHPFAIEEQINLKLDSILKSNIPRWHYGTTYLCMESKRWRPVYNNKHSLWKLFWTELKLLDVNTMSTVSTVQKWNGENRNKNRQRFSPTDSTQNPTLAY